MYGNTLQGGHAEVEGSKVGNARPMRRGSMTLVSAAAWLPPQLRAQQLSLQSHITHPIS